VWSTKSHFGGKRFSDEEEVEMEVSKRQRQQSKDFYAVGFNTLLSDGTSITMLVEDMS
jgi:hypothetical protein